MNRICLISREPRNRFLNHFFLLKTEIHIKFRIQNHFCAILRGWDICKTKSVSEIDKFIFILTWSGRHSTSMALRCPNWLPTGLVTLRGPKGPKDANTGLSCVIWTNQGPVRASWGQSGTAETTLGHYQYDGICFIIPFWFANISAP